MTFRTSGDLGDTIYALPILKAIPGRHSMFFVDRPGITRPLTPRMGLLKPLFEAQDYIEEVIATEQNPDFDIVPFRRFHSAITTLVDAQLNEVNSYAAEPIKVDTTQPWLNIDDFECLKGKIIIARSPRYNNPYFPWRKIVQHYGDRLLFVGIDDEYSSFCFVNGKVNRIKVSNYLELAKLIKGAELFIGNQSSPMAVAIGLGVPFIQESCLEQPDCIFNRKNSQYVSDGACILPDIDGSGELKIEKTYKPVYSGNRNIVPPGYWQYSGLPPSNHFMVQSRLIAQKEGIGNKEAEDKLYEFNVNRIPEFFANETNNPFYLFEKASINAFNT